MYGDADDNKTEHRDRGSDHGNKLIYFKKSQKKEVSKRAYNRFLGFEMMLLTTQQV